MVICRHCQWPDVKVIDSRSTDETVKRRRRCTECGYTWSTYEVPEGDYDALAAVHELLSSSPALSRERRGEDRLGRDPNGSGSRPSGQTTSCFVGFAASILRATEAR